MKKKPLFSLLLSILIHINVVGAFFPPLAMKFIALTVKNYIGGQAKKLSAKIKENIKENLGRDVSVGDLATMNVEMISLVEPFENNSLIVEYIDSKAQKDFILMENLKNISKENIRQKVLSSQGYGQIQGVFNELLGVYIIINESDTGLAEVLLSSPQCPLSREENFFVDMNNPCKDIGRESFGKIIKRYENIESILDVIKDDVEVSGEWTSHLRHIILRLDQFNEILKPEQITTWAKMKNLINSKQIY